MPMAPTWCWWENWTGWTRATPCCVVYGERFNASNSHPRKAMKNTAPKTDTREIVFVLRWKIWAMAAWAIYIATASTVGSEVEVWALHRQEAFHEATRAPFDRFALRRRAFGPDRSGALSEGEGSGQRRLLAG